MVICRGEVAFLNSVPRNKTSPSLSPIFVTIQVWQRGNRHIWICSGSDRRSRDRIGSSQALGIDCDNDNRFAENEIATNRISRSRNGINLKFWFPHFVET